MRFITIGCCLILLMVSAMWAQTVFEEGDWVSFRDYRGVYSLSIGSRSVYIGTTGGVVVYSRFRDEYTDFWARTTGYWESEGLDSARVVAYSDMTQAIWCGAEAGLFQREQPQNRWRKHELPGMLPGYRVLSIGIGRNYLWVEAGPADYWWNPEAPFGDFFIYQGSPYSGGFTQFASGHFVPPISNGLLPGMANVEAQVTWNGRLGKVPLSSGQMMGLVGTGRYNIPVLFSDEPGIRFQEGDSWRPGYFQDGEFRQYAITDWKIDDRGILWLGTWGLGLGVSEVRTQRVSLKPAGLWGEDVQALAFMNRDIWIGGMNDGAQEGITKWRERRKWEGFETPYITGLNSTMVHDFAAGNNEIWVATQQGFSRYDAKKNYWNTLTVFKGLWSEVALASSSFMGDVYVGTDRGLNRISQGVVFREEGWFKNIGVLKFAADGDTLWAVNDDGIFRKIDGKSWEEPGGGRGTIGPQTTDIAVTPEVVWFARRDGVEGYMKKTGEWKSLLATNYFNSQEPTAVAADADNLWVGTGKGIYQFNSEKQTVIHLYQPKDGLLNAGIHILRLEGDYLWIGTHKGLCRFYWNKPNRRY